MATLLLLTTVMINLCTYNSCGSGNGRIEYITNLLKDHDIILIQETWLLKDNLNFYDAIPGTDSHGISGIDDSKLLQGRPHGGCSIIWKKNIVFEVSPVNLPLQSNRMCAVTIRFPNGVFILIINVYMPCDFVPDNQPKFSEALDDISVLVNSQDFHYVLIGGDYNTDFRRVTQNTLALSDFIGTESLCKGINYVNSNVSYTYESKINGEKSILDHFLMCENLFPSVCKYESLHDGDNLSDHCPISMTLDLDAQRFDQADDTGGLRARNLNWNKAIDNDIRSYQTCLDSYLNSIEIPFELLLCQNMHCTEHAHLLLHLYDQIVDSCMQASSQCIPFSMPHAEKMLPGWNETVEEHRRRAIFWHNLWKENGSPRNGLTADIRRRTRAQYHLAIKNARKNKDKHLANKLANSLTNKDDKSFWKDLKMQNKTAKKLPSSMDGHVGKEAIGIHLAQKYERLYSVSFDDTEMDEILSEVKGLISARCDCDNSACRHNHMTTVYDIQNAVKLLNYNKIDGFIGLSTNHLKHGTHRLYSLISLLFTGILQHGYIPGDMLKCTIIPIPKSSKKSLSDSSNYRAISLNSPLCKLLEATILTKCGDALESSDMQFGFKKGLSTSNCTHVVSEVIQYYKNGGGSVYAMLLDASQAFDRVRYTKLLRVLQDKGLCPIIIRVIAYLYIHQETRIKWDDFHSEFFKVSNGVKQGGILSPALFSVYIDVLLIRLRNSGYGCHIGQTFVGVFAYADDIILLCPTRFSLNAQLNIASTFQREYHISFNAAKSQLLFFSAEHSDIPIEIVFQETVIQAQPSGIHLGHIIGPNVTDQDITRAVSDFNKKVNVLISRFYYCDFDTKLKLFQSYCMSLYGSVLWDLSDNHIQRFYTSWRKAVRKLIGVHPMTHSALLNLIIETRPIEGVMESRILRYLHNIHVSRNKFMNLACVLAVHGSRSPFSKSLSYIAQRLGKSRLSILQIHHPVLEVPAEPDLRTAGLIRDLLRLRDAGENRDDINDLIRIVGVG